MNAAHHHGSRGRGLLVFAVVAALAVTLLASRTCSRTADAAPGPAPAATVRLPTSTTVTAAPDVGPSDRSASALAEPAAVPPRMRAITLALDAGGGVRLLEAGNFAGRVKAPPRSRAAERLEFSGYDSAGRRIYEASLDDPRHLRVERIQPGGVVQSQPALMIDPSVTLRIPQELPLARLDVFDASPAGSRLIGSVLLAAD